MNHNRGHNNRGGQSWRSGRDRRDRQSNDCSTNNPSTVMNKNVKDAFNAHNRAYDSWSLFFDKFSGYSTKKEPILNDTIKWYNKSRNQLQKVIERKQMLFEALSKTRKVRLIYLENHSRLLVNIGHSYVLENVGFSFERISGLPFIPGSALKGVVANLALWVANGDAAFEEDLHNFKTDRAAFKDSLVDIFGANEGYDEQGKVNFYGAFPLVVPELDIDILTPHNNKRGNPIPNHFLTVAAGTKWFVPIALNRGDAVLLDQAEILVEKCLTTYGVGAKTASGYGKFDAIARDMLNSVLYDLNRKIEHEQASIDANKQRVAEEKAEEMRRQNLSSDELAFEDFCVAIKGKNDFKGKLSSLASLDKQSQYFVLKLLKTDYLEVWQDALKDYNKGEKKGKKGYKRAKAVLEVASKLGVEL